MNVIAAPTISTHTQYKNVNSNRYDNTTVKMILDNKQPTVVVCFCIISGIDKNQDKCSKNPVIPDEVVGGCTVECFDYDQCEWKAVTILKVDRESGIFHAKCRGKYKWGQMWAIAGTHLKGGSTTEKPFEKYIW